jgi:RHS repeat-associated protein
VDGSNLRFVSSVPLYDEPYLAFAGYQDGPNFDPTAINGTLYFPDGRQYVVQSGLVQQAIDRNGNITHFSYASAPTGEFPNPPRGEPTSFYVNQIVDPTGRTFTVQYDVTTVSGCGGTVVCDQISYPSQDGSLQVVTIRHDQLGNLYRSDLTPPTNLFNASAGFPQFEVFLSEVDLPSGAKWNFYYGPYAEIAKVVLPTGGMIEYDFGPGLSNAGAVAGTYSSGQVLDVFSSYYSTALPWSPFVYRRLLQRRDYNSATGANPTKMPAGAETRTTSYPLFESASSPTIAYGTNWVDGITITSTEIINVSEESTANGITTSYSEAHRYHYSGDGGGLRDAPISRTTFPGNGFSGSPAMQLMAGTDQILIAPDPYQGKEYHYDICCNVSGAPVRVVDRAYAYAGGDARVCQENTTYEDTGSPITATKFYFYDQTISGAAVPAQFQFGNLTDIFEFGFAQSSAIQTQSFSAFTGTLCPSLPQVGSYGRRARMDYVQNTSYLSGISQTGSVFLPSLLASKKIYDGNGAQFAEDDYAYDIAASVDPNGNYSPVSNAAYCGSGSQTYRGNLGSVTRGLGTDATTESVQFDCVGNITKHTDGNGNQTGYSYADSFVSAPTTPTYAYLTSISLPNGASVSRQYDWNTGNIRSETNANNLTTTFDYNDPLNRIKVITRGAGLGSLASSTSIVYNDIPAGGATPTSVQILKNQYTATDQNLSSHVFYDAFGRTTIAQISGAETIQTATVYDGFGRVYQRCNPADAGVPSITDGCITFTLDPLGRTTQALNPDGSAVSTAFSVQTSPASVRVSTVTDETGVSRSMQYDALDRLAATVDATGTASYIYDPLDDLTQVFQGAQTRTFKYDSLKRLKEAHNPETTDAQNSQSTQFLSYTYDANGNLITKTDGRFITCYGVLAAQSCSSSYDSLSRAGRVSYSDPNTPPAWYCYDGQLFSSSAGGCAGTSGSGQWLQKTWSGTVVSGTPRNATSSSFDQAGRLVSSTQTVAGTAYQPFVYNYYNDDQLASVQYPSGRLVVNCYDRNERVVWLSGNATSGTCTSGRTPTTAYATVQGYLPPGEIKQLALGNGLAETNSFNPRLQPTQIQLSSLFSLSYDYTTQQGQCAPQTWPAVPNNGNPQSQTIVRNGVTWIESYCYEDGANRLTKAYETATGGWSETYGYDQFGNRWLLASQNVGQESNNLEIPNGSPWYLANNHISGWSYDGSGNITQVANMFRSFVYDAANRQISAVINGSTNSYEYDGEGRRVLKTVNGTPTAYLYDQIGVAAEYGPNSETGTQFLTADALGSPRLATDSSGNQIHSYDYLPFGGDIRAGTAGRDSTFPPATPPVYVANGIKVGFTGKERDAESGLDYFGARYLSAAQGRFTSPDWSEKPQPIPYADLSNPQTLNLYSYVINNPLNRTDPLGHNWFLIDDKWEWHRGKTYSRTDNEGNQHTYTSKYTGLLVAERTGTNAKGGATYKFTLYDQNNVVGTGTGFSGGRDEAGGVHNPIRDGNYQILTAHDPTRPTAPRPGDPNNNPPQIYSMQEIDPTLNPYAGDVYGAYGPMRARLNPLSGPDVGDYFHGQFNGRGWTHGCLCYGTDPRMIQYIWNHMPNTWVGVSVDVPVTKP